MVLALGVGTTTMVGTCVGAGLEARAHRVTLVSCLLAAAIFVAIGLGVALSGRSITGLFTHVEEVVAAASGYFYATGLVYGFMAVFVILFSAYQGWGRATAPLLVSLLRVAIVLARRMDAAAAASTSAGLAVLSCRRFHGYWSVNSGHRFHPSGRQIDAF
jgi:Na+-driven multidrug efflux pump